MKKRFWIGFQESWIKAVLVDTDINVTTEEVTVKAKSYGTINFIKEQDLTSEPWQYTNTRVVEWENF